METKNTVVENVAVLDKAQDNMVAALERMILFAVDSAEKAGEMLTEQVPDIVMQLLSWHALKYGINAFIGLVLVILTVWMCIHIYKQFMIPHPDDKTVKSSKWYYDRWGEWKTRDNWDGVIFIKICITFLISIIGIVMLYKNLMLTLYIIVAPKLYLIEYGVDLIRKL